MQRELQTFGRKKGRKGKRKAGRREREGRKEGRKEGGPARPIKSNLHNGQSPA
jgi:hypothetical protein